MRKIWDKNELFVMRGMFPHFYTVDLAALLGRSYSSVCGQSYLMGLKKSPEFRKMELQRQADRLKMSGKKFQYPKGHEPANKGKKMPDEVYQKVKRTMFKKGHTPHNTNYDGHERTSKDGYVEIRVKKGKYVLKHRLIWEQAYGKIKKGMNVVFKDRNPQNIKLDNLELITRAENMRRNTIQRYPAELKMVIKLSHKLKRTINEKQN